MFGCVAFQESQDENLVKTFYRSSTNTTIVQAMNFDSIDVSIWVMLNFWSRVWIKLSETTYSVYTRCN